MRASRSPSSTSSAPLSCCREKSRPADRASPKGSSLSSAPGSRSCCTQNVAPTSCCWVENRSLSRVTSTGISCRAHRRGSGRPRTTGATGVSRGLQARRTSSSCQVKYHTTFATTVPPTGGPTDRLCYGLPLRSCVKALSGRRHFAVIGPGPAIDGGERPGERAAEWRNRIFNSDRRGIQDGTRDHSAALQAAQSLCQGLLSHTRERAPELIEPRGVARQCGNGEDRPFARDVIQ